MQRSGPDLRSAGGSLDDTIVSPRRPPPALPPPRSMGRLVVWFILGLMVTIGAGAGLWLLLRRPVFPKAGETEIFNHVGNKFAIFRFHDDPLILVVDCPNLHEQGMMFDRIAALIEKADAPHDRVLTRAEFRTMLAGSHQTVATYYYGDDYPAAALRKFFRLAAAEDIELTKQELRLEDIVRSEGFLKADANGAVISIPQAAGSSRITWRSRAVILRHELAHGAYFTTPSYRRFVYHFYKAQMTPAQQNDFRNFLIRDGYDPHDHDLIVNETIAYMIFTRDPEYFNAQAVGLTNAALASLRQRFEAQMPHFWLRPMADAPLPRHH